MRNTNASSPRRLTERAQIRMESSLTLLTKRPCTNHRLTHAVSCVCHWPTGATNYGMTLNQQKKGGRDDSQNSWCDSCDFSCGGADGVGTGGGTRIGRRPGSTGAPTGWSTAGAREEVVD